ncbi:MAG: recombinase family protein [Chloroflexota bacterium]|nr:recombinase family protein [Chloroflexota bacterium]
MRAAIYCRVSTASQEDGSSLDTQEASCRAFAIDQGWTVTEVYREVFTGAELFDRPQLGKLREEIRRREVDIVIAHALDRLTRNQAHLGVILSEADYAGVAIELVTERLEDTPEGRLLQSVRGFVAEVERLKIAERTKRGRRARTERGKLLPGGKPPYGYQWRDADKGALDPDPLTEQILRRIYQEYASGTSLRSLANRLSSDGIPTSTGRSKWMATTLRCMLRNPAYIGEARAWRYSCTRTKSGTWTTRERPLEEQIALPPGTVPALIDPSTWHAVQVRFARNKAEAPRNNRHPEESLLRSGFVRCGYCGNTVIPFVHSAGLMYRCCVNSRDIPGCRSSNVLVKTLDGAVWEKVREVVTRPEIIAFQLERLQEESDSGADVEALDRHVSSVEKQRQRIARGVAALDDDEAAAPLLVELKALAAQKRQLEADRIAAVKRFTDRQEHRDRLTNLMDWCRRVADNLATLTYAQKRDLLFALDVKVRLFQKGQPTPRWVITMSPDEVVYNSSCNCCRSWR